MIYIHFILEHSQLQNHKEIKEKNNPQNKIPQHLIDTERMNKILSMGLPESRREP